MRLSSLQGEREVRDGDVHLAPLQHPYQPVRGGHLVPYPHPSHHLGSAQFPDILSNVTIQILYIKLNHFATRIRWARKRLKIYKLRIVFRNSSVCNFFIYHF